MIKISVEQHFYHSQEEYTTVEHGAKGTFSLPSKHEWGSWI